DRDGVWSGGVAAERKALSTAVLQDRPGAGIPHSVDAVVRGRQHLARRRIPVLDELLGADLADVLLVVRLHTDLPPAQSVSRGGCMRLCGHRVYGPGAVAG